MATQLCPLAWAPALFAGVALVMQSLVPTFLVSSRFGKTGMSATQRCLLAASYVLLPNTGETLVNLTNVQWHLACLAFCMIVAEPPQTGPARATTLLVMVLSGLTGPFCLLLSLIWLIGRGKPTEGPCHAQSRDQALVGLVMLISDCLQIWCLTQTMSGTRSTAPLGATWSILSHILAWQVFLGALLGTRVFTHIYLSAVWASDLISIGVDLLGLGLIVLACVRGPRSLRYLVIWAVLLLTACLAAPLVSRALPQWAILMQPGAGNRYFFVPMLAWIACIISLTNHRHRLIRQASIGLLAVAGMGAILDLPHRQSSSAAFQQSAARFLAAPIGTTVSFAVEPRGFPPMKLTKHAK